MRARACATATVLLVLLAGSADDQVSRGRALAEQKCASCHAFSQQADVYAMVLRDGPALVHAGNKFRREWLVTWLQAPKRIRPAGHLPFRYTVSTGEGDRVADSLIPPHPAVTREEAEAIASWLATLRRPLTAIPAAEGEPVRGEVHFQKILGCAACHRLGNDGGPSAPELDTAPERLDEQWLRAFVFDAPAWAPATMPRATMRGAQLAALADYIAAPAAKPAPASGGPAAPVAAQRVAAIPADRGAMLYQLYCAQCHGVRGNGKGINAPYLFVAPRDHTSLDEMGMLTDERLFAAIKFGGTAVGKSALMPSWNGTVADADIHLLVQYVRGLSAGGQP